MPYFLIAVCLIFYEQNFAIPIQNFFVVAAYNRFYGCTKPFFGNALFAQAKNFTKKIDTSKSLSLKEISVRSVRLSSRNTSPAPVQILRGAALEKLNGISVADAIRFFSGVQLKDYGGVGGLKTIDVSTPSFFISGLYSVY